MIKQTIGERIKSLRKLNKLTQASLAKAVGVSHVAISQWERSETDPNGENLLALSNALNSTPQYIVKGEVEGEFTPLPRESKHEADDGETLRVSPRKKILLELFDVLPESEADALLKNLEDKKRHYDELYKELSEKRQNKSS